MGGKGTGDNSSQSRRASINADNPKGLIPFGSDFRDWKYTYLQHCLHSTWMQGTAWVLADTLGIGSCNPHSCLTLGKFVWNIKWKSHQNKLNSLSQCISGWEPGMRAMTKCHFSSCSTEEMAQMPQFAKQRQHCSHGSWPQNKGRFSSRYSKPSLVTLAYEQKIGQWLASLKNSLTPVLKPSYAHTYSEAAFLYIHYFSFPSKSIQYKANFPEGQTHLLTITKELGKIESLL